MRKVKTISIEVYRKTKPSKRITYTRKKKVDISGNSKILKESKLLSKIIN